VRYLERLASHDVALRTLGRVRTRFYQRVEPLAPLTRLALTARLVGHLRPRVDTGGGYDRRRSERSASP
jgi:ABC-type transport system involved in cytochrome bd biosynthesis fused ATPase/permease subunit